MQRTSTGDATPSAPPVTAMEDRAASQVFDLDLRGLAVFRVGLGVLLLWDIVSRARFLTELATDDGVLPRDLVSARLPLCFISGSTWFQGVIFALGALAAVMLILGWRTRISTAIGWLVIGSIQSRNQMLLQHGDYLLRLLLFWSMFLPLGARFSLDAQKDRTIPENRFRSVAGGALLVQIACVYLFAGLLKLQPTWLDGDAVGNALWMDHYVSNVGLLLRPFTGLQRLIAYLTLALEIGGPLLLFVPRGTWRVRAVLLPLFMVFHLSLALMLELGNFQYVAMVALLPFVPSRFWDRMFGAEDGAGRARIHSSTASQTVAFGLLVYVMICNLLSLPGAAPWLTRSRVWQTLDRVGWQAMLKQEWSIFSAPHPGRSWLVAPAQLADGATIDVYRGEAATFEPRRTFETYRDFRWRQYIALYILSPRFKRLHGAFAAYLCRRWNLAHSGGERAQHVSLYRIDAMHEPSERVLLLERRACP